MLEILENDLFEKCHSILGYTIISKNFGINKTLLRNSEIGPICKVSKRFGPSYNFIKFWGQTVILENSALCRLL